MGSSYRDKNAKRCMLKLKTVWLLWFRLTGQIELIENGGKMP